jgi:HEAT repeat protein
MLGVGRERSIEGRVGSGAGPDASASVSALIETLSDPAMEVRASAGVALASLRDPASVAALAEIVAGWDAPELARARQAALRTLVAFRGQEAAVALARALTAVPEDRPLGLQHHSALLAVAYAEPAGTAAPLVVRALVGLLTHGENHVAERAVSLLALFPAESQGPSVRALRTATVVAVRRRAATVLGACRQGTAAAALVNALEDPAPEVRAAAARSLGDVRDPASAGALAAAGGDGDESVRQAARSALRKLGTVARATTLAPSVGVPAQRSAG